MEAFLSRKKRKVSVPDVVERATSRSSGVEDDDTDIKLATLASLYPSTDQEILFESLITIEGSVEEAVKILDLLTGDEELKRKNSSPTKGIGYQSSLAAYGLSSATTTSPNSRHITKRGQTLHLYSPEDIAAHTPCSIIHNFLAQEQADKLLKELLEEAPTFPRQTFKLFDNVVTSPHSACFYVESLEERKRQQTDYLYNGSRLDVGSRLRCEQVSVFLTCTGYSANYTSNACCLKYRKGCCQQGDLKTHQVTLS